MAVGFPVKADYATGDVLTAAQMNDLSGTLNTVPGSYGFTAGKNKIINGDFNVNQRNLFTFSNPAGAILADRFNFNNFNSGTNTASIETFTLGTAPVVGYEAKYFARATNSGATATNTASLMQQRIESVRTLANQTATISFYAKADSAGLKIAIELAQNFGTGGSPSTAVNTYAGQVTISTSWARYSVTIAIPSISGKTLGTNNNDYIGLNLWSSAGSDFNSRTGSLGIQNNIFDFWGVQVEAGSVATAFQTATGTIQGELAACQRYYQRIAASQVYGTMGTAIGFNGTTAYGIFYPKVSLRNSSSVEYSNLALIQSAGALPITALAIQGSYTSDGFTGLVITVASGGTADRPYTIQANNNSAGYLAISGEL